MIQDYWKRWRLEYLTSLQARQRWITPATPIKCGTIVLLELPNSPPLRWPLGIIIETFPGKDGQVRVVSVKTKSGTYKRPVVKSLLNPNAAIFLANLVVITPSADITRAYVSTFPSFHRRFSWIDRFSYFAIFSRSVF
ncbi:hypothetical protein NQ318_013491 [Aromia moschata]|uniref:DUF5641 domain-containing protein n=1 Tax=Aromia moschata TaxID=1265417 RepID=A0AAV8YCT1_9CUCU|nr:hypothetical protein NQ318_013491 [Aromia moschata]